MSAVNIPGSAIKYRRAAKVEMSVIDIGESSGERYMPSPFPGMNP